VVSKGQRQEGTNSGVVRRGESTGIDGEQENQSLYDGWPSSWQSRVWHCLSGSFLVATIIAHFLPYKHAIGISRA